MAVYSIPSAPLQPSNVWYASYTIAADSSIQLYWPTTYANLPYVAASQMDVTWTNDGSMLYLPDATSVSVGQTFIITNIGSESGLITGFDGDTAFEYVLPSGDTIRLYLTSSSTIAGTWGYTLLSQTSSSVASSLQGEGLLAAPSLNPPYFSVLNTNSPVYVMDSDFTVEPIHRSKILVLTAPIDVTLMDEAPSNGFLFTVFNNILLSSTITCPSGTTINGVSTFSISGESSVTVVAATDTTWYAFNNTDNTISLGGIYILSGQTGGDVFLNSQQSANQTLVITGELTSDLNVYFYPLPTAGWNVFNGTSEAFTVALGLHDGSDNPVGATHLQGQQTSWRYYAMTNEVDDVPDTPGLFKVPTISGTTVEFSDGSAGAPSITFTNANTTGFFLATPDPDPALGLSIGGTQCVLFEDDNATFSIPLTVSGTNVLTTPQLTLSQTGLPANPVINFSSSPGTGLSLTGDNLVLGSLGTKIVEISTSSVSTFEPIYVFSQGNPANPDYAFYQYQDRGMYADATNLNFSVAGANVLSLTSASVSPQVPIYALSGSAAAPSITFADAPTVGFYRQSPTLMGISVSGTGIGNFSSTGLTLSNKLIVGNGAAATPSLTFIGNTGTGLWNGTNLLNFSVNGNLVSSLAALTTGSGQPLTTNNGGIGSATVQPTAGYAPIATGTSSTTGSQTVWSPSVFGYVYTPILTVTVPAASFTLSATYTKVYGSVTQLVVTTGFFWGASYGSDLTRFSYSVDGGSPVIVNPSVIVGGTGSDVLRETTYTAGLTGLSAGVHTVTFSMASVSGGNPCCLNRSYDGSQTGARSFISIMEVGV